MLPFEQMSLAVLLDHFSSILLVGLVILILVITAKDIVCGIRKPFLDPSQVGSLPVRFPFCVPPFLRGPLEDVSPAQTSPSSLSYCW